MLPKLSESLAGRMEIVTLWPFSQGELHRRRDRFVDCIFASQLPDLTREKPADRDYDKIMVRGGFPETLQRTSASRLDVWFRSYVTAIVQKDIRDLASIAALTEMPKLLSLLASRTGELMNVSELSRGVKIPHTTLKRYLSLLETTFLLVPLLPWSANIGKRLTKSPKIHLVDSGLTSHLIGITENRLLRDTVTKGHLLESFVVTELRKQISWSESRIEIYHFRTVAGREVDVVLEDNQGRVVGVEVKSSATVVKRDFAGLDALSEAVGNNFVRGIVLYNGNSIVPFGERMTAMPINSMWRMK
jgi:predicted AAA+ superfamily ATPase